MLFLGGARDGEDDAGIAVEGDTLRMTAPSDLCMPAAFSENPPVTHGPVVHDYVRRRFVVGSVPGEQHITCFWVWIGLSKGQAEQLVSQRYFDGNPVVQHDFPQAAVSAN